MKITAVAARQVLDCKTRPLLEVEIVTGDGHRGRGAAPTGSSVGAHEAFVLRDNEPAEYGGLGVRRAVALVADVIAPALIGRDVSDQRSIDDLLIELDGTQDKRGLGGNTTYSTSIAAFRAAACVHGCPAWEHLRRYLDRPSLTSVPVPSFNMINGGRYGDVVQPFNEFIVVPYRSRSIESAIESSVRLFGVLGEVLDRRTGRTPVVGPSYGYAAPSSDPRVVLDILSEAVSQAGLSDVMAFALDCASSEMFDAETGTYELNGDRVSSRELVAFARQLSEEFPLLFIEDLLGEDDWEGFAHASREIRRSILLGDDLIVTSAGRLRRAAEAGCVDGFILKPNQVGTISEALDCFEYAERHDLLAIPSGRSGGVIDDVVMDLSVGLGVPFQKNGAPRSGERIEKLNFLIRAAGALRNCPPANLSALARF